MGEVEEAVKLLLNRKMHSGQTERNRHKIRTKVSTRQSPWDLAPKHLLLRPMHLLSPLNFLQTPLRLWRMEVVHKDSEEDAEGEGDLGPMESIDLALDVEHDAEVAPAVTKADRQRVLPRADSHNLQYVPIATCDQARFLSLRKCGDVIDVWGC